MLSNRQYRLVLGLLLFLSCQVVHASTARQRLFAPTRTEKPKHQPAFKEKGSASEEDENEPQRPLSLSGRFQNKNATKVEEAPRRESDNETLTDEHMTTRKEPEKKPRMPDWLGRLRESQNGETDSSTPKQQVTNPWPESVTKRSQVDRSAVNSRQATPGRDADRGWPNWFPMPGQGNQEKPVQGVVQSDPPQPSQLTLKEKKEARVGDADRGWPSWFPLPNEGFVKEEAIAQDRTGSDAPQPLQLTLKEKKESPLGDANRGWPSWFPLNKNNETIVSTEQAVRAENSKENLVSTKESEYETKNALEGRESESRAPFSVSSPSIDILRTIRNRFRQSRGAMEEEREDLRVDESRSPEGGLDDHEGKVPDGMESHQTRIAPSFSSLRESAMNATTFIRRLPWRPIGNERVEGSDSRESKVSPNRNETTKVVVQSEDTSKQGEMIKLETELRQSVSSKRYETMAPTNERQQKLGAPNPIKVFKIFRDLPWTPGSVDPSLTKEVTTRDAQNTVRKLANPVEFIRGLPWTPRGDKRGGKCGELLELSRSDNAQDLNESRDEDSQSTVDPSREQTQKQDNENKGTLPDSSEKNLQLAQRPASLMEQSKAAGDETELVASEIEDIMSKYVERNEDSIDSEGDDKDVLRSSPEQSREEVGEIKSNVTDSIHTYAERYNESENDENDNPTHNRSPEEPAEQAWSIGNKIVESVGQRQESKKREDLSKPCESEETFTNNNTPLSNTTSAPEQMDEQSPGRSTQDSAPSPNMTSSPGVPPLDAAPRQEEDQRPQQQHQQPTMIIMGGPQDGRSMPGTRNVARPPAQSSSIIFAEAIVSIVGAAVRIWLISFFAKWWSEEEVLRPVQHFVWERLNDRYQRDDCALDNVMQLPPANISERQWRRFLRRQHRAEGKVKKKQVLQLQMFQRTVLVLEIGGELNLPHLEQAVTFILSQHREQAFGNIGGLAKELEVVLLVESPGGAVQDFGLAAAQVERLSREAGLTVTACVDKIAASGGYMIASQAHSILAAPFGTVGSIGVIREGINIHDALQKYGIKGLVLKAGDSKVPLTMLGKVTNTEIAKAQRTLDTMHKAFQQLVARGRPQLGASIDDVCNGDIYFGENAKRLSLVDRIVTSEEYLLELIQAGDRVMKLHRAHQYVVGRRKLFHPLDFLRERSVPLRAACARWIRSDLESTLSRIVAATSVMGAIQFLAQNIGMHGRDSGL